jgi:hypothetical protein
MRLTLTFAQDFRLTAIAHSSMASRSTCNLADQSLVARVFGLEWLLVCWPGQNLSRPEMSAMAGFSAVIIAWDRAEWLLEKSH